MRRELRPACEAWHATAPVDLRLQPIAGLPSRMLLAGAFERFPSNCPAFPSSGDESSLTRHQGDGFRALVAWERRIKQGPSFFATAWIKEKIFKVDLANWPRLRARDAHSKLCSLTDIYRSSSHLSQSFCFSFPAEAVASSLWLKQLPICRWHRA